MTSIELQDHHYEAYTQYVIDMTAQRLTPIRSRDFHNNTTGRAPVDLLYGKPSAQAA